ncbi:hypothetical protein PTTG_30179, partial [Puccinia triticina 1-1 BBBD Race 1]
MIPDGKIPPTLIYAPTRNLTWQVLRAIHNACEIQAGHLDPESTFSWRYHSCTDNMDKIEIIEGFEKLCLPIISCTMALGLGQNWKRVRSVVHVGRGDPSSICQLIGRFGCGDGNPGLGVMFVKTHWRNGKNKTSDFNTPQKQTDDNCMDVTAGYYGRAT